MPERTKTERHGASRLRGLLLALLTVCCLLLAVLILARPASDFLSRLRDRVRPEAALPVPTPEEPLRLRVELPPPETLPETTDPIYGWQRDGEDLYYVNQNGDRLTGLQRIDGRLYYFAPDGIKARALGVDVSFYNEDVNWREVRAQGVDFAIVRVGGRGWGSGSLYGDIRTQQYLHNAREAGLRVGVYFYSTAGSEREAAEEARAALAALGGQQLDLPVFIDVEESGEYPGGRSDLLTKDERTRVIDAFCRVIEAAGYEAGVYSGHYFYNSSVHFDSVSRRMVWIANYTASRYDRLPSFPGRYDIWQFTDSAQVKGITGLTDLNVMF